MKKNKDHIVGRFREDLSRIDFYEILESYDHLTLLKKKYSDEKELYLYNNEEASFGSIRVENIEDFGLKEYFNEIITLQDRIFVDKDQVFFWADSKFVTEFGLPGYDKVVEIYKKLLDLRLTDNDLLETEKYIKNNGNIFNYIHYKLVISKMRRAQKKALYSLVKEFRVIW